MKMRVISISILSFLSLSLLANSRLDLQEGASDRAAKTYLEGLMAFFKGAQEEMKAHHLDFTTDFQKLGGASTSKLQEDGNCQWLTDTLGKKS